MDKATGNITHQDISSFSYSAGQKTQTDSQKIDNVIFDSLGNPIDRKISTFFGSTATLVDYRHDRNIAYNAQRQVTDVSSYDYADSTEANLLDVTRTYSYDFNATSGVAQNMTQITYSDKEMKNITGVKVIANKAVKSNGDVTDMTVTSFSSADTLATGRAGGLGAGSLSQDTIHNDYDAYNRVKTETIVTMNYNAQEKIPSFDVFASARKVENTSFDSYNRMTKSTITNYKAADIANTANITDIQKIAVSALGYNAYSNVTGETISTYESDGKTMIDYKVAANSYDVLGSDGKAVDPVMTALANRRSNPVTSDTIRYAPDSTELDEV